ncbi:alpha/beta hydrolase fold [seawater metagenome]|uniref:prolyl aminopeptidase n=1 Tax=seawater metagenome TaxID=1561972 RepID=A0A5E8CKR3_9ZZZZ
MKPYAEIKLKVSEIHILYVALYGNPKGEPVLILHGGAGHSISNNKDMLNYHDVNKYRIIAFDQRGCGKSLPNKELRENTTWNTINDIDFIRRELNINKFHVFGGSWGSTLALIYAITYPANIKSLVLRGIFLAKTKDIEFLLKNDIDKYISKKNLYHPLNFLNSQIDNKEFLIELSSDLDKRQSAKFITKPHPNNDVIVEEMTIMSHFLYNKCFLEDNWILNNVEKLNKINVPIFIIHGELDNICDINQAEDLSEKLPNAKFLKIKNAGHDAKDVKKELIDATNSII